MSYKWKPSRTAARKFAAEMDEIDAYCAENGITQSASSDSYYFITNGQKYRVSNHTVEASNRKAYNFSGEQVREMYHPDGRKDDTVYIYAGKTRLIEIHKAILAGEKLDGRGYPIARFASDC